MLSAATVSGAIGTNSQALWYMTRGFGLIDLVLLTATLVMGLTQVVRYARPGLPRFVVSALHKNISLLAVVFLAVHVVTAVLDTFAPISVASVFIPFVGKYRPLWLGLGALSLDLLLALVVTSLLRERMGLRAWRLLHWTAYLCWPFAIVHGLGTGSDTKLSWVLAIYAVCVAAGVGAIWWRLAAGWRESGRSAAPGGTAAPAGARRLAALAGTLVLPVVVGVWTLDGPLHAGWAKRAGTPAALLGASNASSSVSGGSSSALTLPLRSSFQATQSEGRSDGGQVTLTLRGSFSSGSFTVALTGQPAQGGGVDMSSSQVTVGPASAPSEYKGHVTRLTGDTIVAGLTDSSGRTATLTIVITGQTGDSLTGTVEAEA